jgi:hypothetical protein
MPWYLPVAGYLSFLALFVFTWNRICRRRERSDFEIDLDEFEAARRDPRAQRLLVRADAYGDSLREQGRID